MLSVPKEKWSGTHCIEYYFDFDVSCRQHALKLHILYCSNGSFTSLNGWSLLAQYKTLHFILNVIFMFGKRLTATKLGFVLICCFKNKYVIQILCWLPWSYYLVLGHFLLKVITESVTVPVIQPKTVGI